MAAQRIKTTQKDMLESTVPNQNVHDSDAHVVPPPGGASPVKSNFVTHATGKQRKKTPKVADLFKSKSEGVCLIEPKQSILDMDWHRRQWLCVVVTTDIRLVRQLSAVPGQFGHPCHFDGKECKGRHIKQLSWAHGTFDKAKNEKQPWDRYLTWSTNRQRYDLRLALVEMLEELKHVLDAGGGLCMYDVEFEAGVVVEKIVDLQLPKTYLTRWQEAATLGKALLNMDLLQWAFEYPSKLNLIELHNVCAHVLGKTVSSSEPGLQCWMLLRKMHFGVHKHMSNSKKRALDTCVKVDTTAAETHVSNMPLQKATKVMQPSNNYPKMAPWQSHVNFAVPGKAARDKFLHDTPGFIAIFVEFNKALTLESFEKGWRSGAEQTTFGFDTKIKRSVVDELRVARIVWALGDLSSQSPLVKKDIVRPDGFEICPIPNANHRVVHNEAMTQGRPLGKVLEEFVTDIKAWSEKGFRICAYGLE